MLATNTAGLLAKMTGFCHQGATEVLRGNSDFQASFTRANIDTRQELRGHINKRH